MLKVIYHSARNFLITITKEKRKAALKNEAGRDEKHLFLLLGLTEIWLYGWINDSTNKIMRKLT